MSMRSAEIVIPISDGGIQSIVRVIDKRDKSVGYMHTFELAALLMAQSAVVGRSDRNWIDLLGANGIAIYQKPTGETGVVAVIPRRVRSMLFNVTSSVEAYKAPFELSIPPMLWMVRWGSEDRIEDIRLFWIDHCPASLATPVKVSCFNLGNVGRDGTVCWGTTSAPFGIPAPNYRVIDEGFMTSPFNTDLTAAVRQVFTAKMYSTLSGGRSTSGPTIEATYAIYYWILDQAINVGVEGPIEVPLLGQEKFPSIQAAIETCWPVT